MKDEDKMKDEDWKIIMQKTMQINCGLINVKKK